VVDTGRSWHNCVVVGDGVDRDADSRECKRQSNGWRTREEDRSEGRLADAKTDQI
jgi:hypothetical protein